MLFISFFKTLVEKNSQIKIELKNGLEINGVINHVDYNMNFNISNITVNQPEKYPHLMSLKTCFIRGNSIRYIHLPSNQIDTELLQEACKKEYNK